MNYAMDLATSYEQPDETTYIFHLREGVKFHNGEPFTAADVVYTIETIEDDSVGAWRVSQYNNVASVTALDDYTVEIKLANPQPAFLDNLAYTAIVSKSSTPAELIKEPIGTGAFKFVSWTPNDNITLEKNPEYWEADQVTLDKIVIKFIPDPTVAITNLKSGDVQYFGMIDAETASQIMDTEGLKVYSSKFANSVYEIEVGRHNHPALADPEVMRAMFLAFDRQTVVDAVFAGMGSVTQSTFPSAANYYYAADTEGYDLDKAKEVLSATNFADGFDFTVIVSSTDSTSQQAMTIWQNDLKKIGINMDINLVDSSIWLDEYLGRTYDMITNSYSMVGTDPATYCNVLLGALKDYQTADLTELNELIQKGATTMDQDARAEIYQQIQIILAQYRPVSSYAECVALNGAVDSLNNIMVNGMGHTVLKYATMG